MQFVKRDIILVFGSLCFIVGLMPFMAPFYAILTGIAIFFGIKYLYSYRQKSIRKNFGSGICYHCGSKIIDGICPKCESENIKK